MKEPIKNKFSWSVSRSDTFEECPRKYYFQYYGFWSGWEADADSRTREIYVLKQLKNKATWVGQVVHDCIKKSLDNLSRGIPVLPVEEILAITRDRMRSDFRNSRKGLYRQSPKNVVGLFEHEYALDIPDQEWREAADQVDRCLRTFYGSTAYEELSRLPSSDFLEIEEFSGFDVDGSQVMIKLDCATRENDRIVVWDWKTGRSEQTGITLQMACYAFYASQAYRVPVTHVVARRFDLFRDEIHDDTIAGPALEEVLSHIRGSIKDMLAVLDDPVSNVASEARFAKINRRNICYRCNFLKVCKPEL